MTKLHCSTLSMSSGNKRKQIGTRISKQPKEDGEGGSEWAT